MKNLNRSTLNLKSSVCTETPTGSDLFLFSGEETQFNQNTGMERNGGITAMYEQQNTFGTAGSQSLITKSGDLLQVDASHNIRINNSSIGNVGPYAVSNRGAIKGYSDAAWTAGNTIIAIAKIGQAIKVDEINPSTMAVINTRSTTFTMPSVAITNVILVKYIGMNFADSLTFIISNNTISYSLVEATAPGIGLVGNGIAWSVQTLEANTWNSVTWSPQLSLFVAVGAGGTHYAASSPDGKVWTTRTLAAGTWHDVIWVPGLSGTGLFVAVSSATNYCATSPDGIVWTPQTIEVNQWYAVAWSPQLSLLAAVGWGGTHYAATSPDGVTWTPQTLAGGSWVSLAWSPSLLAFVGVGFGATHSIFSSDGVTWSTNSIESNGWASIAWSPGLGMFAAVSQGATHYVATSVNGTSWTLQTAPAGTWQSITWSPQLSMFVAVGSATNYVMTSTDGVNWYVQTLAANAWWAITWSSSLNIFVAVGHGGTNYASLSNFLSSGTNLCWKFAANKFIIGNQGAGGFAIGDIAVGMTVIVDGTWCVIDIFAATSYSRAILTFPVKKNASNLLTGIGEVGYNQSGTYTATPTYYGVALAAVTVALTNNISGPGYAEATFTRSDSGSAIFYYQAPMMQHNPGQWYDYQESQTSTLCNGYGRLSDFQGNTIGNTCSLRVMMEIGIPTSITAGVVASDAAYDTLGVMITNVGEFDEFYMPHVVDNGSTQLACIYRYNGVLFFVVISSGVTNTIQAVSDNVYMVNTLSPINAVDIQNRSLNLGSNDYNGRILFRSVAAQVASQQVDCLIQTPYVNSSDTGAKFITQTFSTATNIIPGIELPSFVDRAVFDYGVNVYLGAAPAPPYYITYQSFNVTYTNPSFVGLLYIPDTRVPFAMGYTFYQHSMQTEIETVFSGVGVTGSANINFDYLGYEIGNSTNGQFKTFILFGNEYMFDGQNIWLALFNGSLFSGKGNAPVCPATGVIYIASSPTEIFFFSAFDNSLYAFNGGRSLTKIKRMNQEDVITQGAYNVRDNTLCLNGTGHFIWVRDGVATVNAKKSNQTSVIVYDTTSGILIANNTMSWIYSFISLGSTTKTGGAATTTVVPLTWQSSYHSLKANELSVTTQWIVSLFSPDGRIQAPVTLTCYAFDQDNYTVKAGTLIIQPSWWDGLGFCRVRIQPKTEKALASSVQVDTTSHLVITDVSVIYGDDAQAPIASLRSV